jgi:prevent-host-death family protein
VDEIAISKFKATCLAVLHRVRRTGRPILVTRFGRPVAEIVAPASARGAKRELGALAGTAEIPGDVISPVYPAETWESEREPG